jgi:hypothetical protein
MGWFQSLFQKDNPASPPPGPPHQSRGLLAWAKARLGWGGPSADAPTHYPAEITAGKTRAGPLDVLLPQFWPYYDPMGAGPPPHILRKMVSDPYVKSAMLGKILSVCAQDLQVRPFNKKDPFDQKVAAFSEWIWTERIDGGISDAIWNILSGGLIEGYSVNEEIFQLERDGDWKGKVALDSLKALDVGNDIALRIDDRKNVVSLYGLRFNAGKEYDPGAGFLIYRHLPFYNSPTGTSDFRAVYAAWWKLQTAEALRMVFLEKKAIPFVIGKANPSQMASLNDVLSKLKSQNFATVPPNVMMEVINAAGTADAAFKDACQSYREDIFQGIQFATLQSLQGKTPQARGDSDVHQNTAQLGKTHLAAQMTRLISKANRDVLDINFARLQHYPKLTLSAIDTSDQLQKLQVFQGANAMGLDLSKEQVCDTLNLTPPESPDDRLPGQPPHPGGGPPGGPGGAPGSPPAPGGFADQAPGVAVAPAKDFRGYSEQWLKYLERGQRRRTG